MKRDFNGIPKVGEFVYCKQKRCLGLFRKCGVRSAECGVRSAECGVRSAECGVRSAECGVRSLQKKKKKKKLENGILKIK